MQPALWSWVNGALTALGAGWSAAWGDQQGPGETEQGPRPAKPFALLRVLSGPTEEMPTTAIERNISPVQMDLRVRTGAVLTFEVQLFADRFDLLAPAATAVRHARRADPAIVDLNAAGLVVLRPVVDRDLSAAFAGAREFRHVLEFPVRLEMRTDFTDQPWIETVTPPVLSVT